MGSRSYIGTLNFKLLMFFKGILRRHDLGEEIKVRRVILNIAFNILKFSSQMIFNISIVLNPLLANSLKESLQGSEIIIQSIQIEKVMKVNFIDTSNDLNSNKDILYSNFNVIFKKSCDINRNGLCILFYIVLKQIEAFSKRKLYL